MFGGCKLFSEMSDTAVRGSDRVHCSCLEVNPVLVGKEYEEVKESRALVR